MKYVIWGLGAILLILAGFVVYAATGLPDVSRLAQENPKTTAFAENWRKAQKGGDESSRIHQEWVDFKDISPYLTGAVLVSEDINFWEHSGYDWKEIKRALKTDIKKGRLVREPPPSPNSWRAIFFYPATRPRREN